MDKPEINVSYMVTVAETEEEAEFQAGPQDISRLKLMKGEITQNITPEEAQEYPLTEMDRMRIQEARKLHLVGSAKDVAQQLRDEKRCTDLMKR